MSGLTGYLLQYVSWSRLCTTQFRNSNTD